CRRVRKRGDKPLETSPRSCRGTCRRTNVGSGPWPVPAKARTARNKGRQGRAEENVASARPVTGRAGCALTRNRPTNWVYRILTDHLRHVLFGHGLSLSFGERLEKHTDPRRSGRGGSGVHRPQRAEQDQGERSRCLLVMLLIMVQSAITGFAAN